MNTIMLLAGLGLATGSIMSKRETGKYHPGGMTAGTIIGAVAGLMIAVIVMGDIVPMRDVTYGPATLVAMRSSDGVSGTFVWGSGSINSSVNYNFLQKMADGSMSPRSVPADSLVALIEDPELKNIGYWRTTIREADKTSVLYNWAIGTSGRTRTIRQEFRVPVGTVVQQFSIK